MLIAFTLAIMLVAAYALMVEGVFGAFMALVNVILAGLIAFNYWEPFASYLEPNFFDTFLQGYEDAVCLTGMFWMALMFLRVATNQFCPAEIECHPSVQRGGGALFGLAAGYLVSGF